MKSGLIFTGNKRCNVTIQVFHITKQRSRFDSPPRADGFLNQPECLPDPGGESKVFLSSGIRNT